MSLEEPVINVFRKKYFLKITVLREPESPGICKQMEFILSLPVPLPIADITMGNDRLLPLSLFEVLLSFSGPKCQETSVREQQLIPWGEIVQFHHLKQTKNFLNLFLAVVFVSAQAFLSCGKWGLHSSCSSRLLLAGSSLVVEHRL